MNKGKISIIIPVYNTAFFLPKCIDSISNQTYQDFEILLINDGSTDESGYICDYYAELDSRIKVFHLEHKGVSVSRNKGLDEMRGDFLCFLDSDDYLVTNALEILVNEIEESQADVVFFNIMNVMEDKCSIRLENQKKGIVNQRELLRQMLCYYDENEKFYGYFFSCPNKFFRVSSLLKSPNGIRHFNGDIRILEDGLWLMEHVPYLKKGVLDNRPLYNRTIHSASAMGDESKWVKTGVEYLESFYYIILKFIEIGDDGLIKDAFNAYYNATTNYIKKAVALENKDVILQFIYALKQPYRDEYLTNELYRLYTISCSRSFRIGRKITVACEKSRLIFLCYQLLCKVYRIACRIKLNCKKLFFHNTNN